MELAADADLYAAEQTAKARRVQADAEAYATGVVAAAIQDNGIEAAQSTHPPAYSYYLAALQQTSR